MVGEKCLLMVLMTNAAPAVMATAIISAVVMTVVEEALFLSLTVDDTTNPCAVLVVELVV
jgi:hypothetical protein